MKTKNSIEKQFVIDDLKLGEAWRLFKIIGEFVEGVENLQQRRLLKDHHCDMVQGFLYTPALNAEAFSDWAKRYADVHEAQHI